MIPKEWQAAQQVIAVIEQAGFEAVIVGGAVRDYYLQKQGNDVDVATSALPQEVQALFSHTVDIGIEHGTVLVLDAGESIEVTTYRTETSYTDHRRPDEVKFVRTLADDLQRRDFTMNAMALTRTNELIDLFGGKTDLDQQIIRAVGNASERFQEDALRMLRAVRFTAQLGFRIDQQTLEAIDQHAETIQYVAAERIQVELSKIWVSTHASRGITALVQSGLARYLPGDFDAQQWTAFQTTNRLVGWAYFCLVNDDDDAQLLNAYKCSNKDKQFVKHVVQAYKLLSEGWQSIHYFQFELAVLQTAYRFAEWQQKQLVFSFEQIKQMKDALPIQQKSELAVTGLDFLNWTTRKRGPWLKEVLQKTLLVVINREVANDKQQLKGWFLHAFDDEG